MLLQVAQRVWQPATVHDTVAAVARELAFRRSLRTSIADRLMLWLGEAIGWLIRHLRHAPSAKPLASVFVALIVVAVVGRLIVAAFARDELATSNPMRRKKSSSEDPFIAADRFAAEGRFEEAAHAIYRGVLLALARTDRVRLDPSKTSGDYARELRARGSSSVQPFRAFARRFDVAVFGHGVCDAALIDDLRQLAAPFTARARAA